jgi:hypothetical protein
MYASDAMRLGAMATPKADAVRFDERGGTCALGAIDYALGSRVGRIVVFAEATFPWLDSAMSCPYGCADVYPDIGGVLAHLNNTPGAYNHGHDLTREAIADYLEGMEVMLGIRPMPSAERLGTATVEEARDLVAVG